MRSRTTVRDIIDDFRGERLDYWVTGYGTGGTLKGVGRVLTKERSRNPFCGGISRSLGGPRSHLGLRSWLCNRDG